MTWQPMRRARPVISEAMAAAASPELLAEMAAAEMWKNDRYTVTVKRDDKDAMHLSIRRNDRKAARDWRHFQRIKNDIAGLEREAVELYPAESRLVDGANQYHLWVMPPGVILPIGFNDGRQVHDAADGPLVPGAVQRPIARGGTRSGQTDIERGERVPVVAVRPPQRRPARRSSAQARRRAHR